MGDNRNKDFSKHRLNVNPTRQKDDIITESLSTGKRSQDHSTDLHEILADKIRYHAFDLRTSYTRLNKGMGASMKKEEFINALARDFNLVEDFRARPDLLNKEAMLHQQRLMDQLRQLVNRIDCKHDGLFTYNDYVRLVAELERTVKHLSTSNQRNDNFSTFMSRHQKSYMILRMERRQKLKEKQPPPYATYDETFSVEEAHKKRLEERMNRLRYHIERRSESGSVTRDDVRRAIMDFDRHVNPREVDDIFNAMTMNRKMWKRDKHVRVDTLLDTFGLELLKRKSSRGTFETIRMLDWPASVDSTKTSFDRRSLMQKLRETQRPGFNRTVNHTRTSVLRTDNTLRAQSASSPRSSRSYRIISDIQRARPSSPSCMPKSSFLRVPRRLTDKSERNPDSIRLPI